MSTFKPDAGIPLLTEIIEAPALSEAELSPVAPPAPANPARAETSLPDAEQLEQLERELRERVLQHVLGRIDLALEQRVRDSLADVLQTAVEDLAAQIRYGLHQTVRDVVNQAVLQEFNALRSAKEQDQGR